MQKLPQVLTKLLLKHVIIFINTQRSQIMNLRQQSTLQKDSKF